MRSWPLVGRGDELAYVAERITDPAAAGVLIGGEAGVGKTRLLNEVLARTDSHHVERIVATRSAQALPFGALAQLLPEAILSDRADLLALLVGAQARRANGMPALLAVDDAHLLDPMSAAFVHHVAVTGSAKVVLSIRSGEVAPDAIASLYRDNVVPRLELQPISRGEFDQLVASILEGHVAAGTLERLWAIAAGNILFVRELIFDALEAGTLGQERGVWRWLGRARRAPRLREVVFNHIGELPDAQREFLDLLAIAEPLSLDLVEQLAPAASVPDAERRGLITIDQNARRTEVRLGHPLFAEALLLAMPTAQRRRLHRALADAVTSTGARRHEDLLRLAVWRIEAGDQPDPLALATAARQASALGDAHLAERLSSLAAMNGGGFDSTLQHAIALSELSRFDDAAAELRCILDVEPPSQAHNEMLADVIMTTVGLGQSRIDDALGLLIEIEDRSTEPQVRALIGAHRATLLAFAGRFTEAAAVGGAALAIVDDPVIRVRSVSSVGTSLVMAGQIDRALELNDEMVPIALELRDRLPRAPAWVLTSRSTALVMAGRFDEALELIDFALASLTRITGATHAWERSYRGRIALAQGKPATAQRHFTDAAATAGPGVGVLPASWALSLLAEATALMGDATTARAFAQQAIEAAAPGHLAWDVDERRARAWVTVAEARTADAIAELLEAADLASSRGQTILELITLGDALRLGERKVAHRIADLAARTDGPWAAAIGQHAQAELGGDPAGWVSAASAYQAIGSNLAAAEVLATASDAYRACGLRARSTEAARRSRALAAQCEGVRTPNLATATQVSQLSRREREVATMAAAGKTNAEISSALHVSVRTVESHLYSAFAKLGVTGRRNLAQALA